MHGKVGSVRFESFCVGVRFLSFEPLQRKCSHNFFHYYSTQVYSMGDSEPDDISDVNKSPRSKSPEKHSSKDKSLADSSAFAALDLYRDYFEDRLGSLKRELKDDAYQKS